MQDHHRAILKERLEYYLGRRVIFAELETGGKIIECPKCHVPFKPHLGNWMADKFPCERCKANLSFKKSTAKTARCPCCNISRPLPNNLVMLVCGGCQAKVIHQRRDKTVKCSDCKRINITTLGKTSGVRPANQGPPQVNRFVRPQVNLIDSPQVNQVVPPQVNQVLPPHVNVLVPPQVDQDPLQSYWVVPVQVNKDLPRVYRLVPRQLNQGPPKVNRVAPPQVNQDPLQDYQVAPQKVNRVVPPRVNQDPLQVYQVAPQQVNQVVPQQVNRVVPPRVYRRRNRVATAETESTASSAFTPRPEIIVVEYPDNAVAEAVRNVATKRVVEVEEDKPEAAGSKKIHL